MNKRYAIFAVLIVSVLLASLVGIGECCRHRYKRKPPTPVNVAPSILSDPYLSVDSDNNIFYAGGRWYTLTVNCSDPNGWKDIHFIQAGIQKTGYPTSYMNFRYDQNSGSFSKYLPYGFCCADLDVSQCVAHKQGNFLNVTFVFSIHPDALLAEGYYFLAYVEDDHGLYSMKLTGPAYGVVS